MLPVNPIHTTLPTQTSIHYIDVIMTTMASQITSLTVVYSTVYSDTDQRKHQSSASLALVWGIYQGPVNSPHKWPVTRKTFPFDDVIMCTEIIWNHPCSTHIAADILVQQKVALDMVEQDSIKLTNLYAWHMCTVEQNELMISKLSKIKLLLCNDKKCLSPPHKNAQIELSSSCWKFIIICTSF